MGFQGGANEVIEVQGYGHHQYIGAAGAFGDEDKGDQPPNLSLHHEIRIQDEITEILIIDKRDYIGGDVADDYISH